MSPKEVDAAVKIGQLEIQMHSIETKVDNGFLELKTAIGKLSDKVDVVTELKNEISNLKVNDISTLKAEMAALRKNRTLMSWLVPTLSATAGAVLTILIINYLSHGGR